VGHRRRLHLWRDFGRVSRLWLNRRVLKMEFNLVIEIDESQIAEWLADNPTKSLADFKGEAGNACYLGLDCIDAIMSRLMGLGVGNSYVKKEG